MNAKLILVAIQEMSESAYLEEHVFLFRSLENHQSAVQTFSSRRRVKGTDQFVEAGSLASCFHVLTRDTLLDIGLKPLFDRNQLLSASSAIGEFRRGKRTSSGTSKPSSDPPPVEEPPQNFHHGFFLAASCSSIDTTDFRRGPS